jgi:hypothetical protein
MRLRNLAVLLAVFASLLALACWDNQRQMARAIEQGYDANAQLLGAQFQRSAPFAIDGWRPRFIEQSLSVDLQWLGKDGKTHVYRKVPVSSRFEHAIVSGEQIRLITVPVKVLDDETAVPVLVTDAPARFESLHTWLATSSYIAAVAWTIVVAFWLLRWRAARQPIVAQSATPRLARSSSEPAPLPVQRLMIGVVAFAVGAFLTYSATSVSMPGDDKGTEVTAEITSPAGPPYTVRLGWKDGQGGVHHYGPLAISDAYWSKITRDGKLEVHDTRVRVPIEGAMTAPQILDDLPMDRWQTRGVLAGGLILLIMGAGCLLSAARAMRGVQSSPT